MPTETIFTIAAVITGLGVIFGGIYSIYRLVYRIGQALGTDKDGRTLADRLDRVEHQLWENGGSSLADRVNNIEAHVIKTGAEVGIIKSLVLGQNTLIEEPKIKVTRVRKKAS